MTETPVGLPKIGAFVAEHAPSIARFCAGRPEELALLCDDGETKQLLGLNYPFFRRADQVEGKYADRYRAKPIVEIDGVAYRFTNDLYAKHYPAMLDYLASRGLISEDLAAAYEAALPEPTSATAKEAEKSAAGILPPIHIGNAQNLVVRSILGRVRPDTESHGGWEATWEHFDGRCAYCGTPLRKCDKDHVYSINFTALGEHKRGNLVPACPGCNKAKSDQDFRVFLATLHAEDPAEARRRADAIEDFMRSRDYVPLALMADVDSARATEILAAVRDEVAAIAADAVEALRALLPRTEPEAGSDPG